MKAATTHTARSAEETIAFGRMIGEKLKPNSCLALEGTLGAGKTTMVKGIAESLGINEPITSPSFTLISEYEGSLPLHHMDLYRIGTLEEFEMLGAEEMFYNGGITVIEWSEKAKDILPDDLIRVDIVINDEGHREITVKRLQF